jgi:anthranilate synthase/aminodeoxychorismate synthase-like glutamine amidotransferase
MTKLLFIDNYDSFANTIAAYFANAGADVTMLKSDSTMTAIYKQDKDIIVLGPGPNGPEEAGNYLEVIHVYNRNRPILGICLGYQCLVNYFGGNVHPLNEPAHGVSALAEHDGKTIFEGLASPMEVARYHSLGVYADEVPEKLEISATLGDIVMGIRHKSDPIEGIQFHPESVLSNAQGMRLIQNALGYLKKRSGPGWL